MKEKILISAIILLFFASFVTGSLSVRISDQGTNVQEAGTPVETGNLTIEIWDNETNGTLVYNNTFVDSIVNGSWNVNVEASLEYGRAYYKDYKINGVDLDFSGSERLKWYSPLGDIANEDINSLANISPSKVNGTAATLTGNQSFDNGTLVIDAENNRVGIGTSSPKAN
ncbi:hypothetical protein ACFLRC_04865, partial [Candidatus Altiarchaeota archaeon]